MRSRVFALVAALLGLTAAGCGLVASLGAGSAAEAPSPDEDAGARPVDGGADDGGPSEDPDGGPVDGGAGPAPDYRLRLSFDLGVPTTSLAGFPVGVRLTPDRAPISALHSRLSLRFVDADGQTVLPHELERFDAEEVFAWVRVPEIDASGQDFFWVYLDVDEEIGEEAREAVWQSGFSGVWHLDGSANDALGQAHGSRSATDDVEGRMGGAQRVSGGAFLELGIAGCGDTDVGTVSMWILPDPPADSPETQMLLYMLETNPVRGEQNGFGTDNELHLHLEADGRPGLFIELDGAAGNDLRFASGVPLFDGEWHHVAATWERGVEARIVIDGATVGSSQAAWGAFTPDRCLLARSLSGQRPFSGVLDEARISGVARSLEWLAAEAASGRDELVSYGPVEPLAP